MTSKDYQSLVLKAIKEFDTDIYNENTVKKFINNFEHVNLSFENSDDYKNLKNKISEIANNMKVKKPNVIYYLASPPQFSEEIIDNLGSNDMQKVFNSRIVMEKPFGYDLDSAKKLNDKVQKVFNENQIYRIDHYLGKETVQNILFFRFGNSIFEPLWNRSHIDHIQITVAESIGIGTRGSFYEKNGVIRDILQNHIMQLIALVTMEPPVTFTPTEIRDEKVKVFKSFEQMDSDTAKDNTVLGQYDKGSINNKSVKSYRKENSVADDSTIPTFMAGKFQINNWRWSGVPIYVRTGKRLPKKLTEIYIQFKQPPLKLFENKCSDIKANGLIFSLQPEEKTSLNLNMKLPGTGNIPYSVDMTFNYNEEFDTDMLPAYERLLIDCMKGDLTLFARRDGIEAMWKNVEPILKVAENSSKDKFPNYEAGTWGPSESDKLLKTDVRSWRIKDE
jgi:glucose-6-phosphate 1-dehydrogenase